MFSKLCIRKEMSSKTISFEICFETMFSNGFVWFRRVSKKNEISKHPIPCVQHPIPSMQQPIPCSPTTVSKNLFFFVFLFVSTCFETIVNSFCHFRNQFKGYGKHTVTQKMFGRIWQASTSQCLVSINVVGWSRCFGCSSSEKGTA